MTIQRYITTGRLRVVLWWKTLVSSRVKKTTPTDRFSATFLKKHTRGKKRRERREREKKTRAFAFPRKRSKKSRARGGSKKEAQREVLFCCFCAPLICGCKSVSFKNTLNYLFSWLHYEEKTTNGLTFTAQNHAKRRRLREKFALRFVSFFVYPREASN